MAQIERNRNLQDVADKLHKVEWANDKKSFKARCPCHDDKNPSLSVTLKYDPDGKVRLVWHCFAGCSQEAVGRELGLWREPKQNGHANGYAKPNGSRQPITSWQYFNTKGDVVYVKRLDAGQDGKKIWTDPSGAKGPFLPFKSTAFPPDDKTIVVVEGEKCADYVKHHTSYFATTWKGGTNAWDKTDWSCLKGRKVILWPDRDTPGFNAMEKLADHLFELGCKVKAVDIPEGPEDGWDAADCEPGQATELIENAYVPDDLPDKKEPDDDDAPGKTSDFCDLVIPPETDIKMPEHLITNVIEVGSVSLLVGKPGHGKSNLALIEALALASGRSDILHDNAAVKQCKVGLLWCDESRPVLLAKLRAIMKTYNIKDADIAGNLTLLEDQDGNTFPGMLTSNKVMDHIHKRAVHHEVRVIVVDSVATTAPDAEADNKIASRVSQQLTRLATVINGGVMLLHHARKGPVNEGIEEGLEAGRGGVWTDRPGADRQADIQRNGSQHG